MNFITEEEIDRVLGRISTKSQGNKVKGEVLEYLSPQNLSSQALKKNQNIKYSSVSDDYDSFKKQHIESSKPRQRKRVAIQPYIEQEFTRKIRRRSGHSVSVSQRDLTNTSFTNTKTINTIATKTMTRSSISYKNASFSARLSAIFADMSLVALIQSFILFMSYKLLGKEAFYSILNITAVDKANAIMLGADMLFGYLSILAFYLIFFESLSGQTLGKSIAKIKIVDKESQKKPSVSTAILRVLLFFTLFPLTIFGLHNKLTKTEIKTN